MSIFSYMSMQGMMKNTPGPGHQNDHNRGMVSMIMISLVVISNIYNVYDIIDNDIYDDGFCDADIYNRVM